MNEVQEMRNEDVEEILQRVGYGHFACSRNDQPYVVPIHYVYDKQYIYIYTTDGMKTEVIRTNPQVCLQVEEVVDNGDWRSVIVTGEAEQIIDNKEREEALKIILTANPTLMPAVGIRWIDNWVRENIEVVYRIKPITITGRSSVKVKISAAFAQRGVGRRSQIF
jgi:nitroimidazol reductase NimA-like FMN-containing flavoprotein (pyridoxamine 5'-phosphate oxidase superfamily)